MRYYVRELIVCADSAISVYVRARVCVNVFMHARTHAYMGGLQCNLVGGGCV